MSGMTRAKFELLVITQTCMTTLYDCVIASELR